MLKFSEIIAYFESLAENHTDIAHTESEAHFFRFELDDVFTSLGKNIHFPALILEGYDFNFTDPASDNLMKQRNSAFIVLKHCSDENDHNTINQIYDDCEEIGDEILVRILDDKRSRTVDIVKYFDITHTEGNMIANIAQGYYGVRYMFSVAAPRSNDIDTDKWSDK
jgi:hypothetical protein